MGTQRRGRNAFELTLKGLMRLLQPVVVFGHIMCV